MTFPKIYQRTFSCVNDVSMMIDVSIATVYSEVYFDYFLSFFSLACVASVSVGLSAGLKHFSLFGTRKKLERAQKGARRGRGREERKRLPANPMILKNPSFLIGAAW